MPASFAIVRDDEFYVLLKSSLPSGYRVESEPMTEYYSEWKFCYKLYAGDELIHTFTGDYRTLVPGTLIKEAEQILRRLDNPA